MFRQFFSIAIFAMLGLAVVGNAGVHAQATKIGFTDHEVIIANMPEYASAQQRLQQEVTGAQEALQQEAEEFQKQLEEYQAQQRMLSAESRNIREQELALKQQELQLAYAKKDEDIAVLEAELLAPIFEKVQVAIDDVAKGKGLDVVIRHRVGNQPVILYVNPDTVVDITLEVAVKLGIDVSDAETETVSASQ